jgi:hypothetical protein
MPAHLVLRLDEVFQKRLAFAKIDQVHPVEYIVVDEQESALHQHRPAETGPEFGVGHIGHAGDREQPQAGKAIGGIQAQPTLKSNIFSTCRCTSKRLYTLPRRKRPIYTCSYMRSAMKKLMAAQLRFIIIKYCQKPLVSRSSGTATMALRKHHQPNAATCLCKMMANRSSKSLSSSTISRSGRRWRRARRKKRQLIGSISGGFFVCWAKL